MNDSPDREFEIVLGNKQLFSLLFIVFVLLGVFFAMGYLMGRNTLPVDTAAAGSKPATSSSSELQSSRPSAVAPSVETSTPNPTPATSQEPPAETTASAPAAAAPPPEKAKAPAAEPPPPAALTVVEPKPGQTFLQVSAIARPEAELLVEVLQKKGFRAMLAPGPKDNIFRVLIGPERDDAEMAKTRTALEQSGFKPIPRRY